VDAAERREILNRYRDHSRRFEAAAAVCRAAQARFGEVAELMGILSLASSWLRLQTISRRAEVEIHVAVGEFHEVCGDRGQAGLEYGLALEGDGNAVAAHLGLARLRMPGPDYLHHLQLFHQLLVPVVYLEIGVAKGQTLALARPPTVAIGVDPKPSIETPIQAETHVYASTSDDFFGSGILRHLLGDRRVGLAFIDGLHHFDQALRDFVNVERWADRHAVVLVHDTYPLDETTQRRERVTDYWTGDVWKFVACLRDLRRDLNVFTIPAWPAGLTVITGLNPASSVPANAYEATVAKYMGASYDEIKLPGILNLVPNGSDAVPSRLVPTLDRAGAA